jgi:hypothetical protein
MIRSEAIEALASDLLERFYSEKQTLREIVSELRELK